MSPERRASHSTACESKHLAKAKDYIGKGEGFYRKAADEIIAAQREDPSLGYRQIGEVLGRSDRWCNDLVKWRTSAKGSSPTPYGGKELADKKDEEKTRAARTCLSSRSRFATAIPARVARWSCVRAALRARTASGAGFGCPRASPWPVGSYRPRASRAPLERRRNARRSDHEALFRR
jgi:hypothetical protein